MPEGDTIWRTARTLSAALVGKDVTAFSSPLPRVAESARRLRVEGSRIDTVEAKGKHLLMRFSNGAVLRTHMHMTGSWHLYRFGSRWQAPPHLARVVVRAGEVVAVCFSAPTVDLYDGPRARQAVSHLGPDVLAEELDEAEVLRRLRERGDEEIEDA